MTTEERLAHAEAYIMDGPDAAFWGRMQKLAAVVDAVEARMIAGEEGIPILKAVAALKEE
jgi:hypothetical protein